MGGLLIAPYNTAMRLGQGFNSYTQEICIDDAVIIDPGRPLNTLTNDGSTMLDLREGMKGESAYTAIQNLSITEKELLGITDPADTEHDPDPVLEPEVEAPKPSNIASAPVPAPVQQQTIEPAPEPEPESEGESEEETDADTEPEEKKPGDSEKAPGEAEESESKPETDKASIVKKPAPVKKTTEKPLSKEAARKKAAYDKKRAEDDAKQEAAREKARKEADERQKAAEERARQAAGIKAHTKAERDKLFNALAKQMELADKDTAASKLKAIKTRQYERKATGARGPSQIVTYTSSFVDKLSEITDDMNISGALSIKYGTIGGSGRGAFINSEKFKDSDLNFYISVKVVNQTVNIKDALVYQPLRTVDSENFRQVYGDSFISGFIEGGEFNAIVSMKVHNKAQIMNIEAEAKVALTVGVADISAEAAVKVAKKNISNNTETTIMVSWSGGGFIKPMDEPWDIESLTSAAARFPDLVAITPQRTYAILTKYETLRSFMKLKPAKFSKLAYENAQMYTNALLDVYMDYKNLHKKIDAWMADIENNISKLEPNPTWKTKKPKSPQDDTNSEEDEESEDDVEKSRTRQKPTTPEQPRFPVSLGGLDQAKKGCRQQMTRIVNEIDAITADPSLATIEDRPEPFIPVRIFKERMPAVKRIVKPPAVPLRLERLKPGFDRQYPSICPEFDKLEYDAERLSISQLEDERPTVGRFFRLARPVGSAKNGTPFNNVDFLRYDTYITAVKVEVYKGVVSYIETTYSNGLVARHGGQYDPNATKKFELKNLGQHNRIIAAMVETGKAGEPPSETGDNKKKIDTTPPAEPRITRLKLFTNRGQQLIAEEPPRPLDDLDIKSVDKRGPRSFVDLNVTHFDPIMDNSYVKGFWGYSKNGLNGMLEDGIWRLGVIWGNDLLPEVPPTSDDEGEDEQDKKGKKGKTAAGKK